MPKGSKVTVIDNYNVPEFRKMTKVTCPVLGKVTSNLLDFDVLFHDSESHHESFENYFKPEKV